MMTNIMMATKHKAPKMSKATTGNPDTGKTNAHKFTYTLSIVS